MAMTAESTDETREAEAKLKDYIFGAAGSLREIRFTVQETLEAIGAGISKDPGPLAMQVAALRRYAEHDQKKGWMWQWTWSEGEERAYESTDMASFVNGEISKVTSQFALTNPGHRLGTSPLRSLKTQIRLWNGNSHVQNVGRGLKKAAIVELAKKVYLRSPDPAGIQSFLNFIRSCHLVDRLTSAVPGTSDHGQMRAVDFVVLDTRGNLVAGTDTNSIPTRWRAPGWHLKLNDAILRSRSAFDGPLKSPYEPWHYMVRKGAISQPPSGDWPSSGISRG
jgi:hypothetical protein